MIQFDFCMIPVSYRMNGFACRSNQIIQIARPVFMYFAIWMPLIIQNLHFRPRQKRSFIFWRFLYQEHNSAVSVFGNSPFIFKVEVFIYSVCANISLFVLRRKKPAAPPVGDDVQKAPGKPDAAPKGNYIKAEVRGILRLDKPDLPASAYVLVRRGDMQDKVWFWFSEGQLKRWRDIIPKLVGAEVVVRGRIGQLPQNSMTSIPPGAMHFEGHVEIESPRGTPQ